MSGYGSAYRGYPTYNGLVPQTDTWSKTSYAPDHVCKPVIVDAEGRKHPIIYNPDYNTEAYITTETVVQQKVHGYVESLHHHGYVEDKWHQFSSPVHDRPHKVEEFLTKVQTEVSQPKKFSLLSPSSWRQSPISSGYYGHGPALGRESGHGHGNIGYGDYDDHSNKDWHNPNRNTIRNGNYDGHYHNNDSEMEPTMINSGGWARPSRAGWAAPPDTPLSRPTNDIDTATGYLKEAAKPTSVTTSPHSRYTVPITTRHKKDDYSEIIDSREASKRYGKYPPSFQSEEKYAATIDSREAARKYKGAAVPM